ncbi:COMM domain-containing protein 8 isoform X2 [Syngnathoides biaculeatus]|uniref:COMM domain-containing protein 8 isoform X2 n=1 Tax=Syngnathoides biaculeatus TaxID=300417 RepID=UPI002ADDE479|nr:COMM domain-containing protein 8 isoform X2 [Syngnathoides biaculeatus]
MVGQLNNLPVTECLKLCHRVVDGLCGREPPRRIDYTDTWSQEEWWKITNTLATAFQLSGGNNSSDEEVFVCLSELSSSHSEAVLNVLKARRKEICHALLGRTNRISSAILQDFDWQLKTPLLSLCLDIREDGALKPVTLEMNREELNTLISSLEVTNKVLLQLK